jgi:hypothetical protein
MKPHKDIITFGEPGDALYFVEEGGAEAVVNGQVVMRELRLSQPPARAGRR